MESGNHKLMMDVFFDGGEKFRLGNKKQLTSREK